MKTAPRLRELDNGMIHFDAPPGADQVTLCGMTDWLSTKGYEPVKSTEPITCNLCRWIMTYCQRHRKFSQ